jgi:2-isopropylmalate synthase
MSVPFVEVTIFDTTERDGAQALPEDYQFPDGKKAEIAQHIAGLGVGVIEAGFPATTGDAEEVTSVARTVGRTDYTTSVWQNGNRIGHVHKSPVIAGLCRATRSDIEATWKAVMDAKRARIHIFVPTDAEHIQKKFPGKSPEDILVMGSEMAKFAKSLILGHPDATIEFTAEAAATTDKEYLERIIKEVLRQGVDVINVPDTVGQRDPLWMREFYGQVIDWVISTRPEATISAHNHNDLGMAVANTGMLLHAAVAYARKHDVMVRIQYEATIMGIGERAGNADIFSTVAGLFKFSPDMDVPVSWQFNPEVSVTTATTVMAYAGLAVARQSPVVGSDINKHRSGIHSDGILKGGHRLYTPLDPTFWGHSEDAVHQSGKYQGRRGREAVK